MIENLGFGCASLTNIGNVKLIYKLLDEAFELGITHYDTAALYGKGYSEILLGNFIRNKRNRVTITTKFSYHPNLYHTNRAFLNPLLALNAIKNNLGKSSSLDLNHVNKVPQPYKPRVISEFEVERSFLQSLKNLQTSYIDFFLLHEALPSFLSEDALQYLLKLKQSGYVHKIGIASNIHFIKDLKNTDIEIWDILQYEGYNKEMKNFVMNKFLDKVHFHHSILKEASLEEDKANLIKEALRSNLDGKVIFATRKSERLINTVNCIA